MTRLHRLAPALVLLAGCSLEPRFDRPAPAIPASWPAGDAYLKAQEAALPSVSYRDIFRDPRLQAVIEQALASNQDLRVAAANIEEARARYRIQRAEQLPEVTGSARVTTSRSGSGGTGTIVTDPGTGAGNGGTGTGTGTGTGGVGTGTGTVVTTSGGSTRTTYNVNVGISGFELDLFGRLRSLSRAALGQYFATEAGARATRLSLVGEVASAWLTLAADRTLLKIAADTEDTASKSVDLTRARLQGGVAPRTDLRQAETILAQARSDRAQQTTAVAQDRNALELLVGASVADANLPPSIEEVEGSLGTLPAGLDSSILLRRPDVLQAEYTLRSANAQIGAARANFFPRIGLTALTGFASTSLSSLFNGDAFTWSVAPSVSVPIFSGGAIKGNLRLAQAQRDAAVADYQRTIQTAFREVADALARQGTIQAQVDAQRLLFEAAQDTLTLTDASYRGGINPFLNVLDAQRTFYTAQRSLAQTQLARADNLATLYRVLGGDQLAANLPVNIEPVAPLAKP